MTTNTTQHKAPQVKFHYVHLPDSRVITFAYTDSRDPKSVQFNYAVCSPQDQFVKRTGRTIAQGRLLRRPLGLYDHTKGFRPHIEVLLAFSTMLEQLGSAEPSWAQEYQEWLTDWLTRSDHSTMSRRQVESAGL